MVVWSPWAGHLLRQFRGRGEAPRDELMGVEILAVLLDEPFSQLVDRASSLATLAVVELRGLALREGFPPSICLGQFYQPARDDVLIIATERVGEFHLRIDVVRLDRVRLEIPDYIQDARHASSPNFRNSLRR